MTTTEPCAAPGTLYFRPDGRVIAAPAEGDYRWRVIRHGGYLFATPQWEVQPDLTQYTPEPNPPPVFEIPFAADSGSAARLVADRAAGIARGSGKSVTAEFNGTPMNGYPGDTAEIVHLRWHYERLLSQLRHGVLRIEDIPS